MRTRQAGFSLIEILLATTLLAAALALALGTVSAVNGSANRGQAQAARSEQMRLTSQFLRRSLMRSRGQALARDAASNQRIVFEGEPQQMRYVSELPNYVGYGGAYVHTVSAQPIAGMPGQSQLQVQLQMLIGAAQLAENALPVELLATPLASVQFAYRGMHADGRLGDWQDSWKANNALPVQVRVQITDADGRVWPDVLVSLPFASAQATLQDGGDGA